MRAKYVGQVIVCGQAFDTYQVRDGCYIHAVTVSVAGGIGVERGDGETDPETLVAILAAVLEMEEMRGFK